MVCVKPKTKPRFKHRFLDGQPLSFEDFSSGSSSNTGWHKIAIEGKWDGHWMGPFSIDKGVIDQIVQHTSAKQIDTVVDYEHESVFGGRAPAAGWIKTVQARKDDAGNGELWANIEWTTTAAEAIREKEYRYLSPTILWNTRDRKTAGMTGASLHSVALTNKPFLHELPEVRLNSMAALFGEIEDNEENEIMNEKQFKALCLALGLSETSTLEEVMGTLSTMTAMKAMVSDIASQLKISTSSTREQFVGAILSLQNPSERVSLSEFNALKTQLIQRDARDAVAKAMSEGKVTAEGSPMHAWALETAIKAPEVFASWLTSAPKIIPLDVKTQPKNEPAHGLSEIEKEVIRQTGISEETYRKQN